MRRGFLICSCLSLIYALAIGWLHGPVPTGADCGGYLGTAKLLLGGELSTPLRTVPEIASDDAWLYTPLGYARPENSDRLVPAYPLGLSLQLAALGRVAGLEFASRALAAISALGCVLCTYGLSRRLGSGLGWAVAAAVAVGVCPVLLHASLIPLSDTNASFFCALSLLLTLDPRGRAAARIGSGFCLGLAVLVRPTDALLFLPLAIAISPARRIAWVVVGGLPAAGFLLFSNQALFGHVFATGYGPVWELFSAQHFADNLLPVLRTLICSFPFGILGAAAAFLTEEFSRTRAVVATGVWIISLTTLYLFYHYTGEQWWYARFLLPMIPALGALAAASLQQIGTCRFSSATTRRTAAIAIAALAFLPPLFWIWRERVYALGQKHGTLAELGTWLKENVPRDAAILSMECSGAVYYYTELPVLRWDTSDAKDRERILSQLSRSGRPIFAVLFHSETESARARFPADWAERKRFRYHSVWQLRPGGTEAAH